ncbi:MAG: cysteine synthase A [Fidelibacterota bacterium]
MKNNLLSSVGSTPLIELPVIDPDCPAKIFAKLELFNPSGSVKDRIAKHIIEKAEREGKLREDSIVVEATSGNTGISFAMVAALKGYKMRVLMPESMSKERVYIMKALGAEVVLTPEEDGFLGAIRRSREMAEEDPRVFLPLQFENPDNTEAHCLFTGREILEQMKERIDVFVAGVGTGGTIMGVARAFREADMDVLVVAVEPEEAAVLSGGLPGPHKIQGLGDGFVPNLVDISRIDEVVKVSSGSAIDMAHRISRSLGLIVGISSGANVYGSIEIGKRLGGGLKIVTIFPDRGERYFSTDLFRMCEECEDRTLEVRP